jgi:hypothetical protein
LDILLSIDSLKSPCNRSTRRTPLYEFKFSRGDDFDKEAPISANQESIFWPLGKRLMRLSKKGGAPTVVSLLGSASRCVAADDKYIYWGEQHGGLMKVLK